MTAVNSYIEMMPVHGLPLNGPLQADSVLSFEEDHPAFFQRFSRLMPLGNFAQDYYVFLNIIENDPTEKVTDQESFDAYKRSIPSETLASYQDLFYANRQRMQKDAEAWARLLPPYPGIVDSIRALSELFLCAIATSKDFRSVDILLQKYELWDCFLKENILDKDFAESKRDHLVRFQNEHDVAFEDIHFIDDKVLHLIKVKDLGVHSYLSTWGFNSEREHRVAEVEGFGLLSLNDLKNFGK